MIQSGDILLLDIEGTITSITFVKDVLFPYVRENLRNTLLKNFHDETFRSDIDDLKKLTNEEISKGDSGLVVIGEDETDPSAIIENVCHNVIKWMDEDKKLTALKKLQGHMWRKAYKDGLIKGHLYPDVVDVLKQLTAKGVKVYIYSSGSVEAQKLLFTYSCEGDVTNLLSGYFDTTIGGKTEAESYKAICRAIGVQEETVLFLTDVEREAYPCKEAGCRCFLVVRSGNEPLGAQSMKDFLVIESLNCLL